MSMCYIHNILHPPFSCFFVFIRCRRRYRRHRKQQLLYNRLLHTRTLLVVLRALELPEGVFPVNYAAVNTWYLSSSSRHRVPVAEPVYNIIDIDKPDRNLNSIRYKFRYPVGHQKRHKPDSIQESVKENAEHRTD